MKTRVFVFSILMVCVVILSAAREDQDEKSVPDTEVGLSKVSVFEAPAPELVQENESEAGENLLLPRGFADDPPRVPHGVAEFLPITLDENQCIDCHALETKEEGEPTPIPLSHYVDLRNAPGQSRDIVAGARYVCTACHVVPTASSPLVENRFGE